jgi:Tol biopolymer transport system component/tRNA A-37 threonylcarbamoyl transferase component Bud32
VIEAGTTLGPYEILTQLGAGGMGEVYKARDTRLDRIVAIKVLPAHLSEQPDSRERFEREARAVSALNHAHICTLYDVGRAPATSSGQADIDFLVMEYLEGETLADRLAKGALPLDQAIALALQVADALDRAHRQGIVHRDLKPANVMLTKGSSTQSGTPQAKLLDFGLAKLSAGPQGVGAVSMLPTAAPSANLTAQGTIVGTLQYMAPEQLEGLDADARTDIFAFGALVYEMVTGRKAFQGKSQPSLISAIMSADAPSISAVQAMSPPALDHLVKTCLAKDPADRWQTMHDVLAQLKWIAEGGSRVGVPAPVTAARRTRGKLAIALLAIAALLLVAMAVPTFLYFRGAGPADEIRFTVDTPYSVNFPQLSLSPDGRWIAFQARASGAAANALFVRRLDSTVVQPLAGTEGGGQPFWSPDSRYIGFVAGARLKKIAVVGGAPQDLTEGGGPAAWSKQGTILFLRGGSLYAMSASGGDPKPVEVDTTPPALGPQFLPDGNHFIYFASGPTPGIYVSALDSKAARLLVPAFSSTAYIDPGFLIFQRQGTLLAQAFNPKTLAVSGDPLHIVDDVFANAGGRAAFAVSQNGVLVYRSTRGVAATQQFVWWGRDGKQIGPAGKPDAYTSNFDLSPDGTQIALSITDLTGGGSKLWVMDWARGVTTPFTLGGTAVSVGTDVVWAPDGLRLAYGHTGAKTGFDIFAKNASGLGEEQTLIATPAPDYAEDWSRDGRYLAYMTGGPSGGSDIWALPLFGDRKPFPVVESPFGKDEPHFSFDAKWLAYNSAESGTSQVYVISFPARDQKRQISDTGGAQPRWNRDGTELYYVSLDGKMMAVNIKTGAKLDSGIPHVLFDTGISVETTRDQYAVTADGQRFLVLKPLSGAVQQPLTVIVNWTHLLKP